jgi:hypothetical protein
MGSRADSHDLDKLARWHRDLTANARDRFPVYAVFLVSASDRAAHDVFRKFRSSFEACHAGFECLVIFGQHGVSSTVRSLLDEFGLPEEAIPTLALLSPSDNATVYTLSLLPGDAVGAAQGQAVNPWQDVLAEVESAVEKGDQCIDLCSLPGVARHQLDNGPLDKLVGKLLSSLS